MIKESIKKSRGEAEMKELKQYIIALTNLYGMVQKDLVAEIYNSQNHKKITESDIDLIISDFEKELEDDFVHIHKDYFVHEAIIEFDEFEIMLSKKANKPHYIPKKDELLRYVDEMYIEKTKEYTALIKYMNENFFAGDIVEAEEFCEDIYGICQFDFKVQQIFDHFNYRGIDFKDLDQINEVMKLVMDLSNNIRIWENNGFTPQEIFEKFDKPNLKPLPDKPFVIKKEKLGRNDPCPCGSGKKYKKCCLGKEF